MYICLALNYKAKDNKKPNNYKTTIFKPFNQTFL